MALMSKELMSRLERLSSKSTQNTSDLQKSSEYPFPCVAIFSFYWLRIAHIAASCWATPLRLNGSLDGNVAWTLIPLSRKWLMQISRLLPVLSKTKINQYFCIGRTHFYTFLYKYSRAHKPFAEGILDSIIIVITVWRQSDSVVHMVCMEFFLLFEKLNYYRFTLGLWV